MKIKYPKNLLGMMQELINRIMAAAVTIALVLAVCVLPAKANVRNNKKTSKSANRPIKPLKQTVKDLKDPILDTLTVTNHNIGKFRKGFAGDSISSVSSCPFYKLDVIAKVGTLGLTNIFNGSTVNSSGQVAFSGQTSAGYGYYLSNTTNTPTVIVPPASNPLFLGNTQLTENAKAITSTSSIGGTPVKVIEVRDTNPPTSAALVATEATGDPERFASGLTFATVNNFDQPVFSGVRSNQLRLVSGFHPPPGPGYTMMKIYPVGNTSQLRPMIADNGVVVVREIETGGVQRIVLFNYGQSGIVYTIADETQFDNLGNSPGISDDGSIVVFQGDLKSTSLNYNSVYQTTSGPGIFASIDEGGSRRIVRIAGNQSDDPSQLNRDGICSQSEANISMCVADELGYTETPLPIKFNSYDISQRISVVRQQLGTDGLLDDIFTVAFAATPSAASPSALFSNQTGLWTVRTRIKIAPAPMTGFGYSVDKPKPVIQINDTIDGSTVTQIAFFDPISNATNDDTGAPRSAKPGDHRVAFWVQTNNNEPMIVRGTYFDTDEDGLPDHWEQNGVTVGTQFINLPSMGANPQHKDLFVHANWLEPGGGLVFKPQNAALQTVIDAFKFAPVNNPDNVNGINIHIDAGPNSVMNSQTNAKWNSLSRAGSFDYASQVGLLYTSGEYDWRDFDVYKGTVPNGQTQPFYQTGRAAIFRVAFFVDTWADTGKSGLARSVPGTDFIVSLGRKILPQYRGVIAQAGTFMHELGHTLGLKHGGATDTNYKPNYISIMNYSFQLGGLIKADINNPAEIDYSRNQLNTLIETNLNEAVGINDPIHRTLWFRPRSEPPQPSDCVQQKSFATNIDWDVDFVDNETGSSVDLNGDNVSIPIGCKPDPDIGTSTILDGHNDWPVINYNANGAIGGNGAGYSANPAINSKYEQTIAQIIEVIPPDLLIRQGCEPADDVSLIISGQAPVSVNFDASTSTAPCGTIVSYAWDFGDGTNGSGAQTSHIYSTPGTYFATVFLTDNNGNTTLIRRRYQINVPIVIAGTVTYGNAIGSPAPPRFVKNVSVASTAGSPAVGPVITGTPGTYTLTGFGAGSYTIKPTKPTGPNSAITANDAARVAQGVAADPPFVSQNQRFAADASGNGVVSSNDAALIARFVTGLDNFGNTSQWKFFVTGAPSPLPTPPQTYNDSRTYASVTSNLTGEDYVGILIGEVSGNWNPATHPRPAGIVNGGQWTVDGDQLEESRGPVRATSVALPNLVSEVGRDITAQVNIEGVANRGVISYEFDLRYDPSVILPVAEPVYVDGTVSRKFFFEINDHEPGLLRVAVYGPMAIGENGVLLNLRFVAVGQRGSVSPLRFERIMFNEGEPGVTITDGRVEIR